MGKKVGRNEPCPCGSGKKYKRCCLDKQAQAPARTESARPSGYAARERWNIGRSLYSLGAAEVIAAGDELPGGPVHPWVRARIRDWFASQPGRGDGLPRPTLSDVRAMTTEALFALLRAEGIRSSEEPFLVATEALPHRSAWALATDLAAAAGATPRSEEAVGLVVCELWRRLRPEHPSLEMLDELMQAGYDALAANDPGTAARLWLKLTGNLFEALGDEVTSIEEADAVFSGLNTLGNWLWDAEDAIHNGSLDDPDLAREGIAWCKALVERFPETERSRSLRRQEGELHVSLGEPEHAEAIALALRNDDPDDALGYVALADIYDSRRAGRLHDPKRALEVLEEALARPVRNPEDYDIEGRVAYLREEERDR